MADPTRDVRQRVLRVLGSIAPEADLHALDSREDLREQLDIDSMDFLNFAVGLHREFAVDVSEADYPRLRTLDGCVAWLEQRTSG
ncbi:MAG TPA: acyl carrier protein [Planctomycetota bacterium]